MFCWSLFSTFRAGRKWYARRSSTSWFIILFVVVLAIPPKRFKSVAVFWIYWFLSAYLNTHPVKPALNCSGRHSGGGKTILHVDCCCCFFNWLRDQRFFGPIMGKRNAEHSLDQSHLESTPLKQKKLDFESPVCNQEFALTRELVDGTILTDLTKNQWRVGKPIGKCGKLPYYDGISKHRFAPSNISHIWH